jgi:D-glycero-D-manno-heptose 1,7-bisphosphate phosphatase
VEQRLNQPAVFLDRDGVIIENRANYVRTWDDVEIFPEALAALTRLAASPYRVVIVTNQSGVGRGDIPLATAEAINDRLLDVIREAGGRVDAVYMCPHAPADGCDCRKPRPGLLTRAAADLSLDLGLSIMVGDALSDVAAGRAAGVARTILVRTGRGAVQEMLPEAAAFAPLVVFGTLGDVVADLLDRESPDAPGRAAAEGEPLLA